MTAAQAIGILYRLGFSTSEYTITVTDDDRCKILFRGDSEDEAFLGNTWEEVIEDITHWWREEYVHQL